MGIHGTFVRRVQAWLAAQVDWHMLALARDAVLTHGSTFGLSAFITSPSVQVFLLPPPISLDVAAHLTATHRDPPLPLPHLSNSLLIVERLRGTRARLACPPPTSAGDGAAVASQRRHPRHPLHTHAPVSRAHSKGFVGGKAASPSCQGRPGSKQ